MRSSTLAVGAELLLLASSVAARLDINMSPPKVPVEVRFTEAFTTTAAQTGPTYGTFQQLIDHDHPELGTFSQRYVWNGEFYKGAGSPVILMAPSEAAVDGFEGYTTNRTLPGAMAQAVGGGALIIEHRFWGHSSPFDQLTVKNLQYHNLHQAVQDLVYFAKNVVLPFDQNRTSTPDKAPWILTGCSYSGALTAWVNDLAPGTFWGYSASSAVVEALDELWQYFDQVKLAMPQNCSSDYVKVINEVDRIFLGNDQKAKQDLKNKFGLGDIEHDEDVASALSTPLGLWQSTLFSDGYGPWEQWCDYVENQWPGSNEPRPGADGVGLQKALAGFAKWYTEISLPGTCASYGYWTNPNETACFNSFNASSPIFTDLSPLNAANRQWYWFLCNEPFKWWQVRGQTDLVSRLVTKEYSERQCALFFPPSDGYTYGIAKGVDVHHVNRITGGWRSVNTERLQWAVGEWDPWRPATVSSADRPDGELQSTAQPPVFVLPKAAHCNDVLTRNANANADVRKIFDAEVANVKQWVAEFHAKN